MGAAAMDTKVAIDTMLDTRPWHARTPADACAALKTHIDGLDHDEAARRLEAYGANKLAATARTHPMLRFLAQFNNALI